jgi:hypothetical protein
MTVKGWNPLVLLPVAFVVVFVVWAVMRVRQRGSQD